MSISSLTFLIDEAAKNIRRNGLMSVAALTTVTIALAVFGGALFALYRFHQFVAAQPRQFQIAAFVRPDLDRAVTVAVRSRVAELPGVAHVEIVTKEQALAELQEEDVRDATSIAGALGGVNPLPDRLDITTVRPEDTGKVSARLNAKDAFPEIERVRDEHETLDKLLAASHLVRTVGGAVAILLFVATAFVIQNTIRLTVIARRREIRIMHLVGATPSFIRFPLVLEGIFYGAAGAAIASGVVLFVVSQVSRYVVRFQTPLSQGLPAAVGPWVVLAFMVVCGTVLGLASSVMSIRRFLKV